MGLALVVKRTLDILHALVVLVPAVPIIAITTLVILAIDHHSPFYLAQRLTKGGRVFKMVKLRSMYRGADKAGIDIVGAGDQRVTRLGWWIRSTKIDELPQLWNVLIGDMSFVGPRPNTIKHTAMLTEAERGVLTVKSGLTDLASIAFSRQAEFFYDSENPEVDYGIRMRPLKSALGLWYTRHWTVGMDLTIIALTVVALVSHPLSLKGIECLLAHTHAPTALRDAVSELRRGCYRPRTLEEFGIV